MSQLIEKLDEIVDKRDVYKIVKLFLQPGAFEQARKYLREEERTRSMIRFLKQQDQHKDKTNTELRKLIGR